jgi:hypothetical protein
MSRLGPSSWARSTRFCGIDAKPRGYCPVLAGFTPAMTEERWVAAQRSTQSAHFSTWSVVPHGMIGTEEVEFFGEPSMSLSE